MLDFEAWEKDGLFARLPTRLEADPYFYHTLEVPGLGLMVGPWDLRDGIEPYLGKFNYTGRTVLEIGPASGFVTAALEERGAIVVAVDLPLTEEADKFPLYRDLPREPAFHSGRLTGTRCSFWLVHRALGLKALLIESNVDKLDPRVAGFDAAMISNVMQHRRDPISMLLNVSDRARTLVVTEADWFDGANDAKPVMELVTPAIRGGRVRSWFVVSPQLVEDVLTLKGFSIVSREIHYQPYTTDLSQSPKLVRHYTITATKIAN